MCTRLKDVIKNFIAQKKMVRIRDFTVYAQTDSVIFQSVSTMDVNSPQEVKKRDKNP